MVIGVRTVRVVRPPHVPRHHPRRKPPSVRVRRERWVRSPSSRLPLRSRRSVARCCPAVAAAPPVAVDTTRPGEDMTNSNTRGETVIEMKGRMERDENMTNSNMST